jgi:hypothetical protein
LGDRSRFFRLSDGGIGSVLEASNAQYNAAGVGVAWIIPFPIFTISNVESQSCREIGFAMGEFLNGHY